MDAVIQLREVTKRYTAGGVPALERVSLAVAAGEAVAVMGPSGSGKSTLLNLIAGLDKPTSGTVTVAGQRIDALSETKAARYRRTQVGMIFQFFNLLEDLTVADNVLLPAQLAGTPRREARARGAELLAQLGIARYRDSYPGRLSGVSGSGWRSPGPWSTTRRCCWRMSRPGRWTPPPARRSASCCLTSTALGRHWCWSPTTRSWPPRTPAARCGSRRRAGRQRHRRDEHTGSGGEGVAGRATGPGDAPDRAAMTGAAVMRAASAGAARRLVQTMVIVGVLAASSAAAALGLTLLTSANEGFYAAFAAAHGAELAVTFDASKVTAAELARTRHAARGDAGGRALPADHDHPTATGKPGGPGGLPAAATDRGGPASPVRRAGPDHRQPRHHGCPHPRPQPVARPAG